MNATVAFATADETIRLGTGSVAFEAESRDDLFFGKSENRPPNKNFYGYQAFLMKGGVGLALGWSRQIKEQLQCFKG